MNTAEIKLDLFRRIDSLQEAELEVLYSKLVSLLNTPIQYKLTNDETVAVNEAIDASKSGKAYTHEEVIEEARVKYPNLHFR